MASSIYSHDALRRGWANFEHCEEGIDNIPPVRIEGNVPAELCGIFYRNGPGL